jgi:hypothetical protein
MLSARLANRVRSGTKRVVMVTNDRLLGADCLKAWRFPSNHRKLMSDPMERLSSGAAD